LKHGLGRRDSHNSARDLDKVLIIIGAGASHVEGNLAMAGTGGNDTNGRHGNWLAPISSDQWNVQTTMSRYIQRGCFVCIVVSERGREI